MKGWQIFTHSVRLVFSNLDQALRVSLVLYLVQAASQVALFINPPDYETIEGIQVAVPTAGMVLQTLVLSILAVIASLWIAVAWHRFVLEEEYPNGWLPQWHGANMLGYLGRSILLALIIALGVTVASIPFGILFVAVPGLVGLLPILMIGLGAYLFFRMAVMLPAAALGQKMKLLEAWEATRNETGTLLMLTVIVVAAALLIQLPSILHNNPGSVINLVYGLVVNWFATIIGISLLTTLYGHFIEKRPID
jgi:hypothetical protein